MSKAVLHDLKDPELENTGKIWDAATKNQRREWCKKAGFVKKLDSLLWKDLNYCEQRSLTNTILYREKISKIH